MKIIFIPAFHEEHQRAVGSPVFIGIPRDRAFKLGIAGPPVIMQHDHKVGIVVVEAFGVVRYPSDSFEGVLADQLQGGVEFQFKPCVEFQPGKGIGTNRYGIGTRVPVWMNLPKAVERVLGGGVDETL